MYTKAQLQLMAYDTTVTLYKAREKKHDNGGAYHKPDKAKMHDAYVKWKLRRAKRKFDIKKFLGGASKDNDDGKGKESQHVSEG